ncbi:glycosyltransferase [Rubrivivax sp. RP6-9]|uniref:glycosyltransferase n=1 Tax=Rubrivivax sp. RP6-9 TaxID=3415750 RepID=UPI003CC680AA
MHDLVVFSHLRWDFVYQRPQHLLSRLAGDRRVFFVEEPEQAAGRAGISVSTPAPGVTVLRAHSPFDAAGFSDPQIAMLHPLLREKLLELGVRDAVAWFYTPMALPLLDAVAARAVVYDCMDELAAFDFAPPQLLQREADLLRLADLVLTGGPSLYEAKKSRNAHVHCFPSAVDVAHFAPAAGRVDESDIAHPRLGFFGVIDERLNLDLVAALAAADPDWHIVMVGPVVKIDPASLPRAANIHWLGQRHYAELPALVQGWQVCLLPFALNAATRFISPTKTLEYMAAEKPVVSTAVRDVVKLYGEQIRVAGDAQEFVAQCRQALAEDTTERLIRVAHMRAAVTHSSWDRTAQAMRQLLDAVAAGADLSPRTEPSARSWGR